MANYRKSCWTEADVKCPFYIKDDRSTRSISCEGFSDNSEAVTKFRTLAERDRHMGICCVARYTQCPLYKMVYETKYMEDECAIS